MVSLQEFVKRTGAELVAGLIVVGERDDRRVLGYLHDGTYQLNGEGHEVLRNLEKGEPKPVPPAKPRAAKRKAAEPTESVDELDQLDLDI